MSDTPDSPDGTTGGARAIDYGSAYPITAPLDGGGSGMLRLGGALGIAACAVGLAVMVAACAGLNKAVVLSIIPLALSVPGLILCIAGGVLQRRLITQETHVLQALFVNCLGLIGGLLEMAAWQGWSLYHH